MIFFSDMLKRNVCNSTFENCKDSFTVCVKTFCFIPASHTFLAPGRSHFPTIRKQQKKIPSHVDLIELQPRNCSYDANHMGLYLIVPVNRLPVAGRRITREGGE